MFPSTLESIESSAFDGVKTLEIVKIPSNVTTIKYNAFKRNGIKFVIDCTDFSSKPSGWSSNWNAGQPALFKNSVYDDDFVYGDETKSSIIALRDKSKGEYKFPASVKTIGDYVFNYTENLTDLVIPEGIEKLSNFSIDNNLDLKSLSLPSTLKEIGRYAIEYCQYLTEVKYNGTMAEWEKIIKGLDWHRNSPFTKIICTDGEVTL